MLQTCLKNMATALRCGGLLLCLTLAYAAGDPETALAVPPAAVEPAEKAANPVVPDAGKSTGLLGVTYTRAYIAPRFIGKKWAVKQQVTLDGPSPHDALLVSNSGQKVLVISRQKRRLQGVTYEYVVSDELTIDALQSTQNIALCKGENDANDLIVVGQRERYAHPALWAVRVSDDGKLVLQDAQFVQHFVCKRRT